jgi:hypothetical protein
MPQSRGAVAVRSGFVTVTGAVHFQKPASLPLAELWLAGHSRERSCGRESRGHEPLDPFTERFARTMFFSCAASRPSIT